MPGSDDDGPYVAKLRNVAKKYNVLGKIVFLPFLDDLPAAYMLADLVVVPSLKPEPFGRILIEAQAMGRPEVAFNHGGAIAGVINNKTGWCVDACNKENLINTIIESINNSNKRKDYGNSAFKRFQEELNSNIVTNQLIDFIIPFL